MDFDIVLNIFCYYLEGFHFWFPCHILIPSFRHNTFSLTVPVLLPGCLLSLIKLISEWLSRYQHLDLVLRLFVRMVGCYELYVLTTSKVIAGQVPACDSTHSGQLYSAATRPPTPGSDVPLRHIIRTSSQPVLTLS